LLEFQATRFNTSHPNGRILAFLCFLLFTFNCIHLTKLDRRNFRAVAPWISLALFAFGCAALVAIGRQEEIPAPARYSQAGDAFWLAFIAVALSVLAQKPPQLVTVLNVALLIAMVILSAEKNIWAIQLPDKYPEMCDMCTVNYPLNRDSCLRSCFRWSDDQTVYHLAALRLSMFHRLRRDLVLPRIGPVITDLPNRWLSVYVRDYMLRGVAHHEIYSIAPLRGNWLVPIKPLSPFYRGELSTDVLPQPLTQKWPNPTLFVRELPRLSEGQPLIWYLNTPETEKNLKILEQAFGKLGYTKHAAKISGGRYGTARFTLWCFERSDADLCDLAP
jgi:hypothetical protein